MSAVRDQVRALVRAATTIGEDMAVDMVIAAVEAAYIHRQAEGERREQDGLRAEWRERKRIYRGSLYVPGTSKDVPECPRDTRQKKESISGSESEKEKRDPDQDPETTSASSLLPADESPVVLTFPVAGGSRRWGLTEALVGALARSYPAVNVTAEAKRALSWVETNSLKTAKGMPRFLNGWMGRAQNRAGPGARASPRPNGVRVGRVEVEAGKQYPTGEQEL